MNGSHTYTSPGTYTATLTVSGPGGSDSASQTIQVSAPIAAPVAGLSVSETSGTSPLTVVFSDGSSGSVETRSLDYGDGSAPSSAVNGSHTYTSPGTYTATLTVSGPGGSDSTSRTIQVNAPTPEPGPVDVVAVISGPSSVGRGDRSSFSVTLTNVGATTASGVEVSFGVSPNRRIRRLSPGGRVAVGTLSPGGSVTQTWSGRADKQGAATLRAEVFVSGASVVVQTRSLSIVK